MSLLTSCTLSLALHRRLEMTAPRGTTPTLTQTPHQTRFCLSNFSVYFAASYISCFYFLTSFLSSFPYTLAHHAITNYTFVWHCITGLQDQGRNMLRINRLPMYYWRSFLTKESGIVLSHSICFLSRLANISNRNIVFLTHCDSDRFEILKIR
jgi:hypothetical protein